MTCERDDVTAPVSFTVAAGVLVPALSTCCHYVIKRIQDYSHTDSLIPSLRLCRASCKIVSCLLIEADRCFMISLPRVVMSSLIG